MKPGRRAGGIPLAARLVGVVAIPIVATSVLALDRVGDDRERADAAKATVRAVELQRDVAAIYRPAQIQRIALVGLARIDELGLPREIAMASTGIDLEGMYDESVRDLDDTLAALVAKHGSLRLDDGSQVGWRTAGIQADLDVQRRKAGDHQMTAREVEVVFAELDEVLSEALHTNDLRYRDLGVEHAQLDALADVIVSGGRYSYDATRAVVYRSDIAVREMHVSRGIHDTALTHFESVLGAQSDPAFVALRESEPPTPDVVAVSPDEVPVVGAGVSDLVQVVLGHVDYVEAMRAYSMSFHDVVASEVAGEATEARRRADQTRAQLIGIIAVTLLSVLWVLWSVLVPLRRLTRRAGAIRGGQLDLRPVRVSGPRDVRTLTVTMNGMLTTLQEVDSHIARMASGAVEPGSGIELPGTIGVSIRESVERLADVTHRLQHSEELSSAIVDQAADAIWTVDSSGVVLTANEASERLTDLPADRQIGRAIDSILSHRQGEAVVTTSVRLHDRPRVLVTSSTVAAGAEQVTVVIAHDISERSRFEERLAYQASHDALTGLPNRFAVMEHLDSVIANPDRKVAVLFIDVDSFKSVNDTHGHAAGDGVLAELASRIKRSVRACDFVGRLGGDEFVVITDTFGDQGEVLALGERVIREVEQPHQFEDQVFVLSASVGVALPAPGTSALDMIRHADNAVYQAKNRGRGRVELFDETLQGVIEREAELDLELRRAIRGGELRLHLQPVLDLPTGRVIGAEALVRWERPGHGMVPPVDFIPVAEKSSLIFELDRWVLRAACDRLVAWRLRDPRTQMRMAVNISGRHLVDGELLSDVREVLAATGADPALLELELTETHLLDNLERVTSVLDELRAMGISIAVDDFGTGYSSMSYLRHLPIDTLKIDRSFVARATEHGYDSTVIEAMLTIGRTLDLVVVAEGVETEEQLAFVQARGCHRAQGYKIARPMPIEAAEEVIFAESDSTVT